MVSFSTVQIDWLWLTYQALPSGSMPLFFYSGWASTFGVPEKGAEAADRLIVSAQKRLAARFVRIPTKPAGHSNLKPATCSDTKPARVPI